MTHQEKWSKVADIYGYSLKNNNSFLGRTKENWARLYEEDKHLNNVPLAEWDNLFFFRIKGTPLNKNQREELETLGISGVGLYMGACLFKNLVIRDILGVEGESQDA